MCCFLFFSLIFRIFLKGLIDLCLRGKPKSPSSHPNGAVNGKLNGFNRRITGFSVRFMLHGMAANALFASLD